MTMRRILAAASLTLLIGTLAIMVALPDGAWAQATPEPEDTAATPEPVADAATPTAEAIRVITLVAWYQTDSSGEFIQLGPLATNDQLIAGPGDSTSALTGRADFDHKENNDLPRIELGDSIFDAVPAFEDDPDSVFRWTYPSGDGELRPATLVLQVEATAGPYEGFTGSATFVSRSSPGSGVLVIMLNPPEQS